MDFVIFHYLKVIHIKLKDQQLFFKEASELMMDDDGIISPRPSEFGPKTSGPIPQEGLI